MSMPPTAPMPPMAPMPPPGDAALSSIPSPLDGVVQDILSTLPPEKQQIFEMAVTDPDILRAISTLLDTVKPALGGEEMPPPPSKKPPGGEGGKENATDKFLFGKAKGE